MDHIIWSITYGLISTPYGSILLFEVTDDLTTIDVFKTTIVVHFLLVYEKEVINFNLRWFVFAVGN